VDDEASFI
jgi:boron transporter